MKGKVQEFKDEQDFRQKAFEIVMRNLTELGELSKEDSISVWDFFKCISTDWDKVTGFTKGDVPIFATFKKSIISKYKDVLEKNCKIKIKVI